MSTYSSIVSPWLSESLIPKIKDVSGTAFVVAEFRALENDEAHPLYRDPVVRLFLNEDTREAAERVASGKTLWVSVEAWRPRQPAPLAP